MHMIKVLSRVLVTTEGVWDWTIGFIDTLYTRQNYRQNSAIADLLVRNIQLTVTHALGFSVFTSRIQATDFISLIVTSNHT
jgi:hypothetical protein